MLCIKIPIGQEGWDEENQMFIEPECITLRLEHSLVSVSKWEMKHMKPFSDDHNKKSPEEIMDYIKCMTLDENVDDIVYNNLTEENVKEINEYIKCPMTATTFTKKGVHSKGNRNGEIVTSELIYYCMIAYNIPKEFENWHLNRLMTLIQICQIKNDPKGAKKMSKRSIMSQNAALNAARRKRTGSKG